MAHNYQETKDEDEFRPGANSSIQVPFPYAVFTLPQDFKLQLPGTTVVGVVFHQSDSPKGDLCI